MVVSFVMITVVVRADNENDGQSATNSFLAQSNPTTTVTTSTKVITLPDTDGDGILDKDDPHPTISEIYIVDDNNLNGIVDKFEK